MEPKIPQYMTNVRLNVSPFRFNELTDITQAGEANTYNNIFAEAVYLYGVDVLFIEREVFTPDMIFGEYLASTINTGTPMRLFCDELSGGSWGGNGDAYTKFGLQIQDEATFYCPTLIFSQAKYDESSQSFLPFYPKQSDLIYFIKGKKLFEIQHIENEANPGMYIFGNKNSYVMKCRMYTADHTEIEQVQTLGNIESINDIINPSMSAQAEPEIDIVSQEHANFNEPISQESTNVVDARETDPLLG